MAEVNEPPPSEGNLQPRDNVDIFSAAIDGASSSSNLYNEQVDSDYYFIPEYTLTGWDSVISGMTSDGIDNGARIMWNLFYEQYGQTFSEFWTPQYDDSGNQTNDYVNYNQSIFNNAVYNWYLGLDSQYSDREDTVDPNNPNLQTHGARPSVAGGYTSYQDWFTASSGGNTWFEDNPEDLINSFSYYLSEQSTAPQQANNTMLYAFNLLNSLLSTEQDAMYYQNLRISTYTTAENKAITAQQKAVSAYIDPSGTGDSTVNAYNQEYQSQVSVYQSKSSYVSSLSSTQSSQISTLNSGVSEQQTIMGNIISDLENLISTLFAI
jgi:hypothetical protein